ncbi:ribonuclease PH [Thermodesulfovibrio aggregans]|uniref:Ribonuclease PH n=1 Tax=Thermodesulfovibrio aggregans TaxID=86166 RepID=A0A0U9HWH8_9BACT|nr:ribonuclease PH [Thermodesulfovibrio aggregans]GAQ94831.1 ribonuclease PH [Thermodesulfovibrio aggregans]
MRPDGRKNDELRSLKIEKNFIKNADGSVLIELGNTRVICTASIDNKVPPFLKDQKKGWITAEYGMLPRSTPVRMLRESTAGRVGGRTHEIQRLIGRSLRAVVDLEKLGERTIWIDCDVIEADGGTRTASITGGYLALRDAIKKAMNAGMITENPIKDSIAAISVGIVAGEPRLDLCYQEDSQAEVDMNIVMTGGGKFVEIQGTAELTPFSKENLLHLISLAEKGIREIIRVVNSIE